MKNIFRLFTAALVLLGAAACNPSEINNPDNPDTPVTPDQPEKSGITITASIVKTRVTYSDDDKGGFLDQQWDSDDVLFGFINRNTSTRISLKVSSKSDGVATLVAASDGDASQLSALKKNDIVDLVYTGTGAADDEGETITVSMTGQSGDGRIPACMHSRGTVTETNGSKSLDFKFVNDCAIIEIESLTGITEEGVLSSVAISSLFPYGKYTLGADGFSFEGVGDITSQDISLSDGWKVNNEGVVTYNNEPQPILIAVVPISEDDYEEDSSDGINVAASITGVSPAPSFTYSKNTLQCGCCYVISKREVVARTADGQCFATVAEAFNRAKQLSGTYPTAETNVVTLIKDHIEGLGEHPDAVLVEDETPEDETDDSYWDASLMVEIDYDVTLDLNGCTLSLINAEVDGDDTSECFYVYANSEEDGTGAVNFTIKDSRSGGIIESDSDYHIIFNEGTVSIINGSISHNVDWSPVCNEGSLTVDGGNLSSVLWHAVQNSGTCLVNDGNFYSQDYSAIQNRGKLTINGGHFISKNSYTILCEYCESIEINEDNTYIGTEAERNPAVYIKSYNAHTKFTMTGGEVYGPYSAINIEGDAICSISGGIIESDNYHSLCIFNFNAWNCDNPVCTISGGVFINNGSDSAIYCFAQQDDETLNNTLTVKWADKNYSDSMELRQPLMYSALGCPINAKYFQAGMNNFAKIAISGGYLYSGKNEAGRYFYEEPDSSQDTNYCLSLPSNAYIYSNSSKMHVSSNTVDLLSTVAGDKSLGGGNLAYPYSQEFTPGSMEEELEFTYYITSPEQNLAPLSGSAEYRFDAFEW